MGMPPTHVLAASVPPLKPSAVHGAANCISIIAPYKQNDVHGIPLIAVQADRHTAKNGMRDACLAQSSVALACRLPKRFVA